ncbi:MAG: FAD-binding oxidoreductase [Holophaga sp.]|nr:FAD-binding oxidoreductase [Holophaga sp.]
MTESPNLQPPWIHEPPPARSWRSLLKWGAPGAFKHPNPRLVKLMKRTFHMDDADFRAPSRTGEQPVEVARPGALAPESLEAFRAMLGEGGVCTDGYARLQAAYGKTMLDLMRLREGICENLPDAVLYPRNRHDVQRIVDHCARMGIAVVARGGGSSVTRGLESPRAGVSLNLTRHMAKVVGFNETDQTITVEPGLYGPELEKLLNAAPELFGAARRYTCGHFPQSYEFSTVGGWVVTRGAGQNSTYYGKIEDLVLSQEYVTPAGLLRTGSYPAAAVGPDTDQIMMGSEGAFGILTEVTLRVFRLRPGNRHRFSYLFPDWDSACRAVREVMQSEAGFPSVFRLSDPEETDVALKLYGVENPLTNGLLGLWGLEPGKRCLLLGSTEGERGYARNVRRQVGRAARRRGALPTTGLVARSWEHGRFRDPYLREDLQDFGIMTDTLECSTTWSNLARVHREVRAFCHSRPDTICMAHMSHCYPQGANLYFIFIARMDSIPDYLAYQAGILDAIRAQGAALSHHHGIGRMTAPWLEGQIGKVQMDLFRAIKHHLDPRGILNPGGTLGLDLPEAGRR